MNDSPKNVAGERVLTPAQVKIMVGIKRLAPSRSRVFLRAWAGIGTKREAVRAKCLDCSNLVVEEIRKCPATGCPLWRYRPYQEKG